MQCPESEKNMAYNVRIMEKAEEDLSKIVDYISDTLKNQTAADNLLVDFLNEKENIAENPYMYPLSDNPVLQNEGYHRFLFYKNFIALYLIDDVEKIVSIMRIFYAKRDYAIITIFLNYLSSIYFCETWIPYLANISLFADKMTNSFSVMVMM